MLNDQAVADVVAAMGVLPEDIWDAEDDACNCTYQRIGLWKNPYIGETLEVRMCCIWAELYKLFPQFVRVTPAYLDGEDNWVEGQREWDAEHDMPRAIWYRQLAKKTGRSLDEIRAIYGHMEPPKGIPRPVSDEPVMDPIEVLLEVVYTLQQRLDALEAK